MFLPVSALHCLILKNEQCSYYIVKLMEVFLSLCFSFQFSFKEVANDLSTVLDAVSALSGE